jgi:hypothetical protein
MPRQTRTTNDELYHMAMEIEQDLGTVTISALREKAGGGSHTRLKSFLDAYLDYKRLANKKSGIGQAIVSVTSNSIATPSRAAASTPAAEFALATSNASTLHEPSAPAKKLYGAAARIKEAANRQRHEAATATRADTPENMMHIVETIPLESNNGIISWAAAAPASAQLVAAEKPLEPSPVEQAPVAPAAEEMETINFNTYTQADPLLVLLRQRLQILLDETDEIERMLQEERCSRQIRIERLNNMIEKLFLQSQADWNALRAEFDITFGKTSHTH